MGEDEVWNKYQNYCSLSGEISSGLQSVLSPFILQYKSQDFTPTHGITV